MFYPVLLTFVAFASAIVSGMTGLGGGTLLVAAMFTSGLAPKVAVPVHAAVQLASNGARTVVFAKHVHWISLAVFMIGALPTPFFAGKWVTKVDAQWVRFAMALFILVVTWGAALIAKLKLENPVGVLIAGVLAGGVGMIVGATGTLIAPFFLREDWKKETTIGTKAVCQASAHVVKIFAFSTLGFAFERHLLLIGPMAVAVVGGTVLGKKLGQRLSEERFKLIFRLLLTALAGKLLFSALWTIIGRK